jgi:hypothetical protein
VKNVKTKWYLKKPDNDLTYRRSLTLYFTEEISELATTARHLVVCLQTKLMLYAKNGRELLDIVSCCNPSIHAAISKTISNLPVVACLFASESL